MRWSHVVSHRYGHSDVTGALVVFTMTYLLIASQQLRFLKLERPVACLGANAWLLAQLFRTQLPAAICS